MDMILDFVFFVGALMITISIHEFSHAYVAYLLGDPTAKIMGRVTLNPLAHLDLLGTFLLIFLHFGWGKPVPVDPRNFKKPVEYSALVSIAGTLSNLLICFVLAIPLKYLNVQMPYLLEAFLWMVFDLSLVLFIFNMLPFPPLDGSKFYAILIPQRWQRGYQYFLAYGVKYFAMFVLLDLFVLPRIFGVSLLSLTIGTIFVALKSGILLGT